MFRAGIQLAFVILYLWSGYTTAQHRVCQAVNKIQHWHPGMTGALLEPAVEGRIRYTQFREAKKIALELLFRPAPEPKHVLTLVQRSVPPQKISLKAQYDAVRSHPRPPPFA